MADSTSLPTPVTPILIQQPANPYDARKAVECGVDGIVVSNHAVRQVDGAIASLDALEKIVEQFIHFRGSTKRKY